MSEQNHNCPECNSSNTYPDGNMWACPECFHEWTPQAQDNPGDSTSSSESTPAFLDANGVPLSTGDTVATTKDLKMGKDTIKSGTKVKNIRLLDDPVDGHDIACKLPGHGSIYLKCSVVKKLS